MTRSSLPGSRIVWVLVVCMACWHTAAGVARAEARSIQEFMTFKDKWNDFVVTGYVWQLEGRYAGISDGVMTFVNCPLPFRLSTEQANSRGTTGVVEVNGKIVQGEKGLQFQVEKFTPRPRDLDRLKTMRFGINSEKGEEWYQLADWARARGAFYNDQELVAAAADLDRLGLQAELRQVNAQDLDAITRLLQKAREKRVDESLLTQIAHDALQTRFTRIQNAKFDENACLDLQVAIQNDLPGATTPLAAVPEDLSREYAADTRATFAAASPENRLVLARLFLIDVIVKRIRNAAQPDGSNGFEIADRLLTEVPEQKELAAKYQALATAWHMGRLKGFTRQQLGDFTTRLEKLGKNDQVLEARRSWLKSREALYRQDGARGLADLGQQWASLLGDQEGAAQFFIEAWRENPQYTPATEWLTTHGYQLYNQTWLRNEEVAQMPANPRDQAIREGRIEAGMTATQVQAALGAVPTSATRVASRKQVSEWWVYREAGIVVYFSKTSRDKESVVTRVDRISSE